MDRQIKWNLDSIIAIEYPYLFPSILYFAQEEALEVSIGKILKAALAVQMEINGSSLDIRQY